MASRITVFLTGLVTCPVNPASMLFWVPLMLQKAVRAISGISVLFSSASIPLMNLAAVYPSNSASVYPLWSGQTIPIWTFNSPGAVSSSFDIRNIWNHLLIWASCCLQYLQRGGSWSLLSGILGVLMVLGRDFLSSGEIFVVLHLTVKINLLPSPFTFCPYGSAHEINELFDIVRPSPVPPNFLVIDASAWMNSSKISSIFSLRIHCYCRIN